MQRIIDELSDAATKVDEVLKTQSASIEEAWPNKKLDLVPGDILLDMVCKRFGTRFRKTIDGEKLARLVPDQEIPLEIRSIIRDITR